MNNFSLLSSIVSGPWAIEPIFAQGYLPLVDSLLRGTPFSAEKGVETEYIPTLKGSSNYGRSSANDSDEKFVQVIPVKGVITKNDQYCGPSGTETLSRRIKSAANNPQVAGIILDFDTGGGEGMACQLPVQTIEEVREKIPVVANVGNGICASAGYYIASACDEIYASFPNDGIGSIGTFMTLADMKGYYESKGLNIMEVYASKSSNKNLPYLEALKGNTDLLKKEVLDPFNQEFLDTVMKHRGLDASSIAHTGKMFRAAEAQSEGLIDGIKKESEIISRVFDLAENPELNLRNERKEEVTSSTTPTPPKMENPITKITNLFKSKTTIEMDITKMKSKLSAAGDEPIALSAAESASLASFLEASEKEGEVFTQAELDIAVSTAVTASDAKKDEEILTLTTANETLTTQVATLKRKPAAETNSPAGENVQSEEVEEDFQTSGDQEAKELRTAYNI